MKIAKIISKKFYLFIIMPIIFCLALYFAGKIKTNPKEYEKVDILVSALNLNNELLEEEILESKKVNVKQINVNFTPYKSNSMSLVYNTIYEQMDVFVFPKSFLDQMIEANFYYYAKLKTEVISSYVGDVSYYEYNGEKYGIKIYDSLTKKGWCDSIINYGCDEINEDYYMFFYSYSVNLGSINNSNYDNALAFMKAMSEYED